MPVNLDKPLSWKADIALSVDMYNDWFMKFAPKAFRDSRNQTIIDVAHTLAVTANLTNITPAIFKSHPNIVATLRMSSCPPLAVDRLIGLSGVKPSVVKSMEKDGRLPTNMAAAEVDTELAKIGDILKRLADPDIFVWLGRATPASAVEIQRAATIVADRLCGSIANPIVRNAQEQRQLKKIGDWLDARGYTRVPVGTKTKFRDMAPGTYSFRLNVPVGVPDATVNIPVDTVVMRKTATQGDFPLLIEAKSAGDFTNTNKRRKEEAQKINQLRATYGHNVEFILFLCGYFDSGYLGYEASEGIDWVWEHRIDDLLGFGL